MEIEIRKMNKFHWEDVSKIYFEGIQTGKATFQTEIPQWDEWDKSHLRKCRYIGVNEDDKVVGWVALTPVSSLRVYKGVAEVSVYVAQEFRGKNIGSKLLNVLISESEKAGIWTLQAGIFTDNFASVELHKKLGFREVGTREMLGKTKTGEWKDVALLERRSTVVGVE